MCCKVLNRGKLVSELPSGVPGRMMLFPQHSTATGATLVTEQLVLSKTEEDREKCTQMPSKGFKTNSKDVYTVRKA